MQKEVFKSIIGYEGLYEVSNLGRVKSLKRKGCLNDRILKSVLNGHGYYTVGLRKEGKTKTLKVHKLVAIAFLNHVPNGHTIVIDHINNDKSNNKLDNLQLITQRKNCSKDRKGYSSKYVGVYWAKDSKKWIAYIQINGKRKHLGSFTNELEASEAYQNELNQLNNK